MKASSSNAAVWLLAGAIGRDHITLVLRTVRWLPIIVPNSQYWLDIWMGPGDVKDHHLRYDPTQPLRSLGKGLLGGSAAAMVMEVTPWGRFPGSVFAFF